MNTDGPTLTQMLLNLSETAADSIKLYKEKGVFFAPKDVVHARIDICAACPHTTHTMGVWRCQVCGCGLTLKLRMAASSCPIGKWRPMSHEKIMELQEAEHPIHHG